MNPMNDSPRWCGIIPPMVTPLLDQDQLDIAGLNRLIDHMIDGGVHGLFVLGTTGEGPSLGRGLRAEVVSRACEHAAGRVPVVVCVTDTAYSETRDLARHAARCGADAVVIAPPYYLPISQAELLAYARRAADEMPLPVLLYNIPSCTKVAYDLDSIEGLMAHPNVQGLKDSTGDMLLFHREVQLMKDHPGKSLLMGAEELLADAILLGGHGGVCGGGNLVPSLFVGLYEAALRDDAVAVRGLHARIMRISTQLYTIGKHRSSPVKGIKCALSCLGVCSDVMAEPLQRFTATDRAIVQQRVEDLRDLLRPLYAAAPQR